MTTRKLIKDLEKYNSKDLETLQKFYKLPKMPKKQLLSKIAKLNLQSVKSNQMPYGDCTNKVELFSQDDWGADNEPSLKVTFYWYQDFSKKQNIQCYDRDNLKQWLSTPEHTLYKWISNVPGVPIDPMGYGGGPSNSFTVQNWPDSQFVLKTNILNVENIENINAYPIAKNMRIGRQFGISQNHGQLPGFVVFELSKESNPKEFYINKICKTLFKNVNIQECKRNFDGYTIEQLFLIMDSISESNPDSCYVENYRQNPIVEEPVREPVRDVQEPIQNVQVHPQGPSQELERSFVITQDNIVLFQLQVGDTPINVSPIIGIQANDRYYIEYHQEYYKILERRIGLVKYLVNPHHGAYCELSNDSSYLMIVFHRILYIVDIDPMFAINTPRSISSLKIRFDFESLGIPQILNKNDNIIELYIPVYNNISFTRIKDNRIISSQTFTNILSHTFIARPDNILDVFYVQDDSIIHDRISLSAEIERFSSIIASDPDSGNEIRGVNYRGNGPFETILLYDKYKYNVDTSEYQIVIPIDGTQRVNSELLLWGHDEEKTHIFYKLLEANWESEQLENNICGYISNNNVLNVLSLKSGTQITTHRFDQTDYE
jgi:hypothetical protein